MNINKREVRNFLLMAVVAAALGIGTAKVIPMMFPRIMPSTSVEGNYQKYFPSQEVKVVVYGTSWCPYCKQTREYLAERKIEFADLDIEKSKAAREQFTALGGQSLPLVLIGNRKITGYSKGDFDFALQHLQ